MTDKTRELVQDMLDTMYEADGVGLAAPQVGILKRIAVIDISPEQDSPIISFCAHNIGSCHDTGFSRYT